MPLEPMRAPADRTLAVGHVFAALIPRLLLAEPVAELCIYAPLPRMRQRLAAEGALARKFLWLSSRRTHLQMPMIWSCPKTMYSTPSTFSSRPPKRS